jgi:hypothetical protein
MWQQSEKSNVRTVEGFAQYSGKNAPSENYAIKTENEAFLLKESNI